MDNEKLYFHRRPYKDRKLSEKELANIVKRLRKRGYANIADCAEQYPEGVFYERDGLMKYLHIYVTSPSETWEHLAGREGDLYLTCITFKQAGFKCKIMN